MAYLPFRGYAIMRYWHPTLLQALCQVGRARASPVSSPEGPSPPFSALMPRSGQEGDAVVALPAFKCHAPVALFVRFPRI